MKGIQISNRCFPFMVFAFYYCQVFFSSNYSLQNNIELPYTIWALLHPVSDDFRLRIKCREYFIDRGNFVLKWLTVVQSSFLSNFD